MSDYGTFLATKAQRWAGIGSEGYVALRAGRRFVGIELKPEYAAAAVKNLRRAEALVQR